MAKPPGLCGTCENLVFGRGGRASCSDASNYIADSKLRGVSRSGDVKLFLRDDKLF